jgi:hypothetical protein
VLPSTEQERGGFTLFLFFMSEVQLVENVNPHSVELSRSATGKVTISVKTYGATTEEAYNQTKTVFDKANIEYPLS